MLGATELQRKQKRTEKRAQGKTPERRRNTRDESENRPCKAPPKKKAVETAMGLIEDGR